MDTPKLYPAKHHSLHAIVEEEATLLPPPNSSSGWSVIHPSRNAIYYPAMDSLLTAFFSPFTSLLQPPSALLGPTKFPTSQFASWCRALSIPRTVEAESLIPLIASKRRRDIFKKSDKKTSTPKSQLVHEIFKSALRLQLHIGYMLLLLPSDTVTWAFCFIWDVRVKWVNFLFFPLLLLRCVSKMGLQNVRS